MYVWISLDLHLDRLTMTFAHGININVSPNVLCPSCDLVSNFNPKISNGQFTVLGLREWYNVCIDYPIDIYATVFSIFIVPPKEVQSLVSRQ